jgi:hypothetical protein
MTFVGWSAFSALVLLAVAIGGLTAIYNAVVRVKTQPAPAVFPQPRVDTHQTEDLHRILNAQRQKLEAWGWANDQHTLAQVPIERAMQLLATKGGSAYDPLLPPQPALSSPTSAAQRAVTPEGAPQHAPAANSPTPREKQP